MGKEFPPPAYLERNPVTYEMHKREVFRQITLPLAIGLVFLLAACVALVYFSFWGNLDASRLADTSLIWLILPMLFVLLIFLAVTAGLAYALIWAINKLPPVFLKIYNLFVRIGAVVRKASDAAVEPVLKVEGMRASWRTLWRRLSRQ